MFRSHGLAVFSELFSLRSQFLGTSTQEWNVIDGVYSKGEGELIWAGRSLFYLLVIYFPFVMANKWWWFDLIWWYGLSEREAHLDQEGDLFSYLQYVVKSVDGRTCWKRNVGCNRFIGLSSVIHPSQNFTVDCIWLSQVMKATKMREETWHDHIW